MNGNSWLTERFEEKRGHLRAVAYRILGSRTDAEDAVQEAWVRLSRADTSDVQNLGGWLTTVVARVCLDMLRSRKSRHEEPLAPAEPAVHRTAGPEDDVLLADSLGLALLVVLDTLTPAERVAFVLHDMFDVPFDDIAPIVGRTPVATRQLASRARNRVQGKDAQPDRDRQRDIVEAFLAASRNGEFERLLELLDPDVVLRADSAAVKASAGRVAQGAPPLAPEIRGARMVAGTFSGRATAAQLAFIDGMPGAVWAPGGHPRAAFIFTVAADRISGMEIVVDPVRLGNLRVEIVATPSGQS